MNYLEKGLKNDTISLACNSKNDWVAESSCMILDGILRRSRGSTVSSDNMSIKVYNQ